jgi:hypothetical protein
MDLAPSQHDHFFRALMERPKAAGALLRERLPPIIAEQLVGDPLLVEGTFVDKELRSSQSDRCCVPGTARWGSPALPMFVATNGATGVRANAGRVTGSGDG